MSQIINNHLSSLDLDIRKSNDARFMDQKVTPDVLCIIADCIIHYINDADNDYIEFKTKDIWNYKYSNDNVKNIFNKPDVLDDSARSEYDKFFQQPLKALGYARVLICTKRNGKNTFKVVDKALLQYIAIKERNALNFIIFYIEKLLRDSNIWRWFEDFFDHNDKEHFNKLKANYEDFIIRNTPINGKTEVRRIFTKVLNPLAFKRGLHGTKGGFYSKFAISFDELMYNRRNWRDISKKKDETREQYELRAKKEVNASRNAYVKYTIQKAREIVRKYHYPKSEIDDKFANDIANHVHHIFMGSDYPQIESYIENLILLTANQHLTHAHPHNNTQVIDKDYQLVCLLSKSDSIEQCLNRDDPVYSKEDFLFVLEIGLKKKFDTSASFQQIKDELVLIYNKS
jgi:hypothetical protein